MLAEFITEEKKMNVKPILKNIDIEDIIENELNFYSQEGIKELANNINHYGLLKPLEVYKKDDEYILLGGHRRLKALKQLFENDEIDAVVPCLVYASPKMDGNQIEERLKIITSNAQRELTKQDKIQITKELLDILEEMPEIKPSGMPTREWVAPYIGCSSRTVQTYINEVKGIEKPKKEEKFLTKIEQMSKAQKNLDSLKNNICNVELTCRQINMDDGIFDTVEQKDALINGLNVVKQNLEEINKLFSHLMKDKGDNK